MTDTPTLYKRKELPTEEGWSWEDNPRAVMVDDEYLLVPVEPNYEAAIEPVAELISFIRTNAVISAQDYHDAVDGFLRAIVDAGLREAE